MRTAAILLCAVVLLAFQTTVLVALPAPPDLVLPLCLYLALNREPVRGGLAASVAGYLADLYAGGPRGLLMQSTVVTFFLASLATRRLLIRGAWFQSIFTFVASCVAQLLSVGLLALFQQDFLADAVSFSQIPVQALFTGIAAPLLFSLCARIDRVGRPVREEGVLSR